MLCLPDVPVSERSVLKSPLIVMKLPTFSYGSEHFAVCFQAVLLDAYRFIVRVFLLNFIYSFLFREKGK